MAITRSIADMQYPLLKAIENLGNRFEKLEARMDARFEKLEARIEVHRTDMKADVDRLTDRLGNQTLVLAGTVIASHLGVLAILKLF